MFIKYFFLMAAVPLLIGFGYTDSQPFVQATTRAGNEIQDQPAISGKKAAVKKGVTPYGAPILPSHISSNIKERLPKNTDDPANKSPYNRWKPELWLVVFSGLLVVVVSLQLIWIVRQEKWMGKNLSLTREAANAAQKSANVAERSLNELESPYLFVEIMDAGMVQGPDPIPPPPQPWNPFFEIQRPVLYRFVNHGKTPAMILQSYSQCAFIEEQGKEPPRLIPEKIRIGDFAVGERVITANGGVSECFSTGQMIPQGRQIDRRLGEESLWFQGYVRYRSFFNYSLITGFRAKFDLGQGKFVLNGNDRYNYTRKEEAEETFEPSTAG